MIKNKFLLSWKAGPGGVMTVENLLSRTHDFFGIFSSLNFKTELTLASKFMELETGLTSLLKRHKR